MKVNVVETIVICIPDCEIGLFICFAIMQADYFCQNISCKLFILECKWAVAFYQITLLNV